MSRASVLGGESAKRGFFGGGPSRRRTTALVGSTAVGLVLVLWLDMVGVVLAVVIVATAVLAASGRAGHSPLERLVARQRLRDGRRRGTDVFEPFDSERWDELVQAGDRRSRKQAAAMRQMPDGADGMGWLDLRSGVPGVAWHVPFGEESYLSVAFEISGQLQGLESQASVDAAAEAFGRFQASLGSLSSLATGVQTLTRVLPPDSALHERWVLDQLDHGAPPVLLRSYDELVRHMSAGAMVQRHFVVVRWPRSAQFDAAAARYGQGRDGWRLLMRDEVESVARRLQVARLGTVRVLTARQTAAVIRHMQNPSWPVDQVSDVDATNFGQAGRNERDAHVVIAPGPSGALETWYHRTAMLPAEGLAVAARDSLWVMPILTGLRAPVIRTLSFNRIIVPTGKATRDARNDVVADQADRISRQRSGKLADDETDVRLSAAQRRRNDLRPGSGHAGVEWVTHLTVSARSRDELEANVRLVSEACETGLGQEWLRWMDSYQSAASGLTWPIARGIESTRQTFGDRLERRLAN